MNKLGNDIISLSSDANRKSFSNPRYLQHVFTAEEIRRIYQQPDIPIAEYFWSCKESAYKVLVKNGLRNSFSPGLYEVSCGKMEVNVLSGTEMIKSQVLYGYQTVFSVSIIQSDYVHTISSTSNFHINQRGKIKLFSGDNICFGVKKTQVQHPYQESRSARDFAITQISDAINCGRNLLVYNINTSTGIPSLSSPIDNRGFDISISHDCGWLSFACAVH